MTAPRRSGRRSVPSATGSCCLSGDNAAGRLHQTCWFRLRRVRNWHESRTRRDVVIKMNTGGGKTVVGLLVLKACINEGLGPAVYVAADHYLCSQVRAEAAALGLP